MKPFTSRAKKVAGNWQIMRKENLWDQNDQIERKSENEERRRENRPVSASSLS